MGPCLAADLAALAQQGRRDRNAIDSVGRWDFQIETAGVPEVGRSPGGAVAGLGGPAALIEAIPAQEARRQGHSRSHAGGPGRACQSGGAVAEEHWMVAPGRQ
jgi:hypothetical protein